MNLARATTVSALLVAVKHCFPDVPVNSGCFRPLSFVIPETTFLAEYATILYVFTFAHGLFLGVFLTMLNQNWRGEGPSPWLVDVESFRNGLLAVAGFTVLELLYDALSLSSSLSPGSRRGCRSLSGGS
jgi:hypothetical protein